ncbi:MAG: helix-turn-helix transcriptional regulator [Oscillospiraceae bacterium]|nr:helix-turn-helix transcriptional regulator [Oscillospiraceae bacterium]
MADRLDKPELHCRIERLRKDLHMSQPEFAVALGMEGKKGRSTVNNWESGANKVKDDDLKHIAQTFGVSSDWLLGLVGIDEKSPSTEIRAMREYTGLNDSALFILNKASSVSEAFNSLCKDDGAASLLLFCASLNGLRQCITDIADCIAESNSSYEELKKQLIISSYALENSFRNLPIVKLASSLIPEMERAQGDALLEAFEKYAEVQHGEHKES